MTSQDDVTSRVVFEALWSGVINDWDNDERHNKLLDHVRTMGMPAFYEIAKRYAALKEDPERKILAQKRLHIIEMLATQALLSQQTARPTSKKPPWPVVLLAVLVCAGLLGWVFVTLMG